MLRPIIVTVFAFIASISFAVMSVAHDEITVKTILETQTNIVGGKIVYPKGDAKITMALIEVPVGKETSIHIHDVILAGYILEGELTVNYGSKGTHVLKAGDGIIEATNWPHFGKNTGNVPLKILAVYAGNAELPNAKAVEKLK